MLKDTNNIRDIIFFITMLVLVRNVSITNSASHKKPNNEIISTSNQIDKLDQISIKLTNATKQNSLLKPEHLELKKINILISDARKKLHKKSPGLFLTGPLNAFFTPIKKHNLEKDIFKISNKLGEIVNKILKKNKSKKEFISQKNTTLNLNLLSKLIKEI